MSLHAKVHTQATVNASGNSAAFTNPKSRRFLLSVALAGTPTGTTPTITFAVQTSPDGVTWTQKGAALATLNAIGNQRTLYGPSTTQGAIVETFIRVAWVVTGTTPVFPNVTTAFTGLDC